MPIYSNAQRLAMKILTEGMQSWMSARMLLMVDAGYCLPSARLASTTKRDSQKFRESTVSDSR